MTFDAAKLNRLYQFCLALTGHPANAQDVLQSAIERYLQQRKNVDEPMAYIRQTARHLFYDQLRRQRCLRFETLTDPDLYEGVEQQLDAWLIDQQSVAHIYTLLTPQERESLFLWAVEGMTAQEIADQLGEARGTILSRLHRIRQRLKALDSDVSEGQHHGR